MNDAVQRIFEQYQEETEWALYCSLVSNAFAENLGSFEDFRKTFGKHPEPRNKQSDKELNVKLEVDKATKILSGFVPPKGGA